MAVEDDVGRVCHSVVLKDISEVFVFPKLWEIVNEQTGFLIDRACILISWSVSLDDELTVVLLDDFELHKQFHIVNGLESNESVSGSWALVRESNFFDFGRILLQKFKQIFLTVIGRESSDEAGAFIGLVLLFGKLTASTIGRFAMVLVALTAFGLVWVRFLLSWVLVLTAVGSVTLVALVTLMRAFEGFLLRRWFVAVLVFLGFIVRHFVWRWRICIVYWV